ncbi:prepilin peptidase [Acidobacteriia bacterium AH_259_A11_L15]|nr:prepilin peptidase [Acidobacteriia bacterium AH_259_A11_L15]
MIAGLIFLFGLALGSFLNVCIYRLPKGESVIRPRSRCPHCGRPITAYDNIPLISYLLLRGECRACRAPISALYPVVEGMTGLALALAYLRFGWTPGALKVAVLAAALIVLTFTDLRDRLLPDAVTYPGMGVGFLFALWVPVEDGTAALLLGRESWHPALLSLADGLLGALLGAGLLFVLGEVWYRLRGVEAMGLGDVKMMGMVGLFFGVKLTLLTLFLASLVGSLVGGLFILLARKGSQYELPLGTFLGLAGLVGLYWGRPLVQAYLQWAK